ncbi:MAG TPA: hypothetical protein EYG73_05625 [Arcobacter sp.]|nr:hypothetical protein [Arcobacter sp.]
MDNKIQTRAIPKKSFVIMAILILLGAATFFMTENGKAQKVTRILTQLGYTNVSNVKVYGTTKVENKDTKIQGFKYFVIFTNLNTKQECRGFVLKDFKRKTAEDISCGDKK